MRGRPEQHRFVKALRRGNLVEILSKICRILFGLTNCHRVNIPWCVWVTTNWPIAFYAPWCGKVSDSSMFANFRILWCFKNRVKELCALMNWTSEICVKDVWKICKDSWSYFERLLTDFVNFCRVKIRQCVGGWREIDQLHFTHRGAGMCQIVRCFQIVYIRDV